MSLMLLKNLLYSDDTVLLCINNYLTAFYFNTFVIRKIQFKKI
jgi:hypothetical protein